jgi:aldehyde dehydrogenase (NAD+)
MRRYDKLYIGGEWVEASSPRMLRVIDPASEEPVGESPEGMPEDMDRAVRAARAAFDSGIWSNRVPQERGAILKSMAANIRGRIPEISELLVSECGITLASAEGTSGMAAMMLDYYADLACGFVFSQTRKGMTGDVTVRQEPCGVVGAIVPWNGPLYLLMLKCAPALAAGCTVVAKPAPETPLSAYFLAEAAHAAGLPPGVLNIVAAARESGEHLVRNRLLDRVSFTGSTASGRRVGAICGEQLKRVGLELGGKSAAIVLSDASVEDVVRVTIPWGLALNSGQACVAITRILLPRSRYAEFTRGLTEAVRRLTVGDPRDRVTDIGPLISERQRARVESYIEAGQRAGARITVGGARPSHLPRGWYVEPTLFADATNDMSIAQEEIFGPVVVLIPYDGEEEAIRLANDSPYGLGGVVITPDERRGFAIAKEIRTGSIGVNQYTLDFYAPFGGYKASGLGRQNGPEGFMAFLEAKSIYGVEPA